MANWEPQARAIARQNGIPEDLFVRQIRQESGGNPTIVSPAGAVGIMQIVPKYHPGVNPRDPVASMKYAANWERSLYHQYGNWHDVLSVYNSGRPWAHGKGISETNHYVKTILGGGNFGAPGASSSPQGQTGQVPPNDAGFKSVVASSLLQTAAQGGLFQPGQLLGLAIQRKQMQAAQSQFGAQPQPGKNMRYQGAQGIPSGAFSSGNLEGVNKGFYAKVQQAVRAAGGTQIKVTSGYRSPQHNAAVGGVPHSNHMTGHAVDGSAYVPGKGWVPLGTLLSASAPKYGLRSGDQPGFYHGGRDTVHVDDGYNQR